MTGLLIAALQAPLAVPRRYSEGNPHHVTLQYGVEQRDWESVIGLPMTAGALAVCHNDRVQAVAVALPTWVQCCNPHPHVTVSWIPGAHPVESNAMLYGAHHSEPAENFTDGDPFLIHTLIEWVEWGGERLCSVCGERKLRSDNKSGVCARCQPRLQKNSRYR